ncbi:MAG TPA: DUF1028 domain-containing protein [Actinomycetota bacterium]|nr:DUF1028 domain-containing protein [Actinomycetota bacterium]
MTFSIVAADPRKGDWGVATASKFPAVGAVVPWARAGAGAVATQSVANTDYGPRGLDLMEGGISARQALDRLLLGDKLMREQRQVGLVDARGRVATFTGSRCEPWAGGVTGEGFACQGNLLVGEQVVAAMAEGFRRATGDLVDRLLQALIAGDLTGGDRRGRQSAALLVVRAGGGYEGRNDRYADLRVDDHPQAASELARIFSTFDREILIRDDPLLPATPELVAEVQRRLAARGIYGGEETGELDALTRAGLERFAGELNLEGRLREDGQLSDALLRELRDLTPEIG